MKNYKYTNVKKRNVGSSAPAILAYLAQTGLHHEGLFACGFVTHTILEVRIICHQPVQNGHQNKDRDTATRTNWFKHDI